MQLSELNAEEFDQVVSLPYRAGLCVSYAEDEEGERDDALEMEALEACLKTVVADKKGFIVDVAQATLDAKDLWESWEAGVFNIESLCVQALDVLKSKNTSEQDRRDYAIMVVEVASAVAQAYGEFGEVPEPEVGFLEKAVSSIFSGFSSMSRDDAHHPMNVSAAEGSVIQSIKQALLENI